MAAPAAGLLIALVVGSFYWFARRPIAGFAAAFFFLALAPTSSVVPIATEPVAEHRLYLPLAAFAVLGAVGLYRVGRTRGPALAFAFAAALAILTSRRNETYRTDRALWAATVQAAPKNPRAHYSFALALIAGADRANAEVQLQSALALTPDYVAARHALGELLSNQGRVAEAVAQYRSILQVRPDDFVAYTGLGTLALQQRDLPAAVAAFEEAVRVQPASAAAHNNLGCAYCEHGDFAAALVHEQTALRLKPDYAEAHFNLGNVYVRQNRLPEACESYRRALGVVPDYAEAHAHLGVALQNLGERAAAIGEYHAALRLRPDFAFARKNLTDLGEH